MFKNHTMSTLQTPRDFIPISSGSASRLTQGSIEVKKDNTISPQVEDIKITYPNGVVLQLVGGYDLEMLKRLVHDYDQNYTRDIAELLPDNLKDAKVL
jgi:hypothetical protein